MRKNSPRRRSAMQLVGLTAIVLVAMRARAEAGETSGAQIYADKCIVCHGDRGDGTADNPARLEGDLSVAQLADVIAETMPEDDPGSLSAAEAEAVALYVHDAFYSPIARARNRPPRIDLARLTVRQYRNAVADLVGSFSGRPAWSQGVGLRGEYYRSRQPGDWRKRAERRIDRVVNFDFGVAAPVPEIEEPRTFSIRWTGSVLAPETGEYEFVVRTEHAARLWLNNDEAPLIDAWVKSGDETEYSGSAFLVGGRPYAVRLEFTKAKQGVDDSEKQKEKPPSAPASIALLWRRPQRIVELIPTRCLSPQRVPESFVCSTPFPPDDRSYGWERGAAVSQAWDQATTSAAIEALGYIAERIDRWIGAEPGAEDRPQKLRTFCEEFTARAFRRPLDEALRRAYVERQFDVASDADAAVRRVVLLALKSPRFLFREIDEQAAAFNVASRLSFGLWDSIPDQQLWEAALEGRLETAADVRAQAERMADDVRARSKLREALLSWLHVDAAAEINKDPQTFPDFDENIVADLRTSLELFLDDVIACDDADYRQLLLCDEVYLNRRLARFFAVESGDDDEFHMQRLDDGRRAGVLTHPYIMARFAYNAETSPIHRGVFLARGVLGRHLQPPPEAFAPLAPDLHPELTTRERVTLQTKAGQCMSCHAIINPLGFTLEHFDAVGRFRNQDRDKPVDPTVAYETPGGDRVELGDARELADYLVASDDCHAAFVEQLFHRLVQQSALAYGSDVLSDLNRDFAASDFNIRKLSIEIMAASALVGRESDVAADESAPAASNTN